MAHVPTATSMRVDPFTVQMAVVSEAYETGRPDEAVALNGGGIVPSNWLVIGWNAIVWPVDAAGVTNCESAMLVERALAASPA